MCRISCICTLTILGSLLFGWTADDAQAADAPQPASVQVYPEAIALTTSRDRQSLLVQAVMPDGTTQDVTDQAQFTLPADGLVRQEGATLYPTKDGQGVMAVAYGGHSINIPVQVTQATVDRPISFRLDVMPVFMKSSCNNGSCHGAARGKDGFRLSLFGFDPEGDYYRLTREISGRRINIAVPERSLMIEKSIGTVPHTGGKRFEANSELNNTLIRWLEAGAPNDQGNLPTVDSIKLYPLEAVLQGAGATQRLSVLATYSDGTTRDVTSLAYFMTNNDNSAEVSQTGVVTASNPGEAFISARFDTHTVGSQFIVLPKESNYTPGEQLANNYIDELINDKLRKLRIAPSELCTDEEFLRRSYLDLVGKLPTVDEYNAFMADTDPQKRAKTIDELLGRKEFVELWVMKWAELLQIREVPNRVDYKSAVRYYEWLKERIAANVPWDTMVQELLASRGGTFANAATNYYQNEQDTLKTAENVAQVFMGMRIQCAQCHNHPFDRWTMDDYYSFAAFFSQVGRKRGEDPRELIIFNQGGGEVQHPVTKQNMKPKFLGGDVPELKGRDRREVLVEWLASPDNPYFAKNFANIIWAHFLGRGIIDQVDDVRVSNPAVNSALLDELGSRLTTYKYDFRQLVRDICNSRTYQMSTQANETNGRDSTNFSHAHLRRIRAEVLLDCIYEVTGTTTKFRGLPVGARAVQIADGNTSNYFLQTFGRASRETVCSCEVRMEPNLSQALHLINGDTANEKIQAGKLIPTWLGEGKKPQEIVERLYISCLTRKPTEAESAALNQQLASAENPQQVLEDIFWALLNSREFLFNH